MRMFVKWFTGIWNRDDATIDSISARAASTFSCVSPAISTFPELSLGILIVVWVSLLIRLILAPLAPMMKPKYSLREETNKIQCIIQQLLLRKRHRTIWLEAKCDIRPYLHSNTSYRFGWALQCDWIIFVSADCSLSSIELSVAIRMFTFVNRKNKQKYCATEAVLWPSVYLFIFSAIDNQIQNVTEAMIV